MPVFIASRWTGFVLCELYPSFLNRSLGLDKKMDLATSVSFGQDSADCDCAQSLTNLSCVDRDHLLTALTLFVRACLIEFGRVDKLWPHILHPFGMGREGLWVWVCHRALGVQIDLPIATLAL